MYKKARVFIFEPPRQNHIPHRRPAIDANLALDFQHPAFARENPCGKRHDARGRDNIPRNRPRKILRELRAHGFPRHRRRVGISEVDFHMPWHICGTLTCDFANGKILFVFTFLSPAKNVNTQKPNGIEAMKLYEQIIKKNIDYDIISETLDKAHLDEIVTLMVETVCSSRKTIRVAGDDFPAEVVKAKFLKLDSTHIEYVLDCMKKNTTEIRNIKQYLLATLFNASNTIDSYYTALVNHDMNRSP